MGAAMIGARIMTRLGALEPAPFWACNTFAAKHSSVLLYEGFQSKVKVS